MGHQKGETCQQTKWRTVLAGDGTVLETNDGDDNNSNNRQKGVEGEEEEQQKEEEEEKEEEEKKKKKNICRYLKIGKGNFRAVDTAEDK